MDLVDDGYVTVRIQPADNSGPVEVRLDLFFVWSRIKDVARESLRQDGSDEVYYQGVVEIMRKLGLPEVSWLTAGRFADQVAALVEGLKKKPVDANTPGSPASTDSIPGN